MRELRTVEVVYDDGKTVVAGEVLLEAHLTGDDSVSFDLVDEETSFPDLPFGYVDGVYVVVEFGKVYPPVRVKLNHAPLEIREGDPLTIGRRSPWRWREQ